MKEPQTEEEIKHYNHFLHDMIAFFEKVVDEEEMYWNEPVDPDKDAEHWKMLRDFLNTFFGTSNGFSRVEEKYKKAVWGEYGILLAITPIREKEIMEMLATLPRKTFHTQLIQLYDAKKRDGSVHRVKN